MLLEDSVPLLRAAEPFSMTGQTFSAGTVVLPDDPARLLHPAREGAEHWLDQDYSVMNFAPSVLSLRPGNGPPHIRLDQVAQFLLGDRL